MAFIVAALLLCGIYAIGFFKFHPEFKPFAVREATPLTIEGSYFQPVAGEARRDGDDVVLTEFTDGRALLALKRPFQAEDHPFLKFHIEGLTTWAKSYVYWRRADNPGEFHKLELNRSGDGVTQVAMAQGGDAYRGQISELVLTFFSDDTDHDNGDTPLRLQGLELRPFSYKHVIGQVLADWLNPPLWLSSSVNRVPGVHSRALLHPNAAFCSIAFAAFLLVAARRRLSRSVPVGAPDLLAVGLCLCLLGFAANEALRWRWHIEQLSDTTARFAYQPLADRVRNSELRCGRRDDCFDNLLPYF